MLGSLILGLALLASGIIVYITRKEDGIIKILEFNIRNVLPVFLFILSCGCFVTFGKLLSNDGSPIHISELANNGKIYCTISPPDSLDINPSSINNSDLLLMATLREIVDKKLSQKIVNVIFTPGELMILDQKIMPMDSYFLIKKIDISPWKYVFKELNK